MNHADLPERWKLKVKEYIRSQRDNERKELTAGDFSLNQKVQIKFDDDSFAEFHYPLVINGPEFNEVGVFTEHCGYHIFSLVGTTVNLVSKIS